MRRVKLVLVALVVAVTSLAAISSPAMADLNCRNAAGALIKCNGDYYAPYYNYYTPYYYNPYSYYRPYYYNPYPYYYWNNFPWWW